MSSITKFDTAHEDLIHDVAYDFYGKRLVTCSSDQRLKVWDFVEGEDAAAWELNDSWKAHDASILKVMWAHPEYGQIIASCSFDRQVKIWEEQTVEPRNSQKRWIERFRMVESRGAVLDLAFSPIAGALRLATCSADGSVRIYEALEPTNLAQWSQMEEFEILPSTEDKVQSSLSQAAALAQQGPNPNSTSSSSSSIASHGISTPGIDTPSNVGPFSGNSNTGGLSSSGPSQIVPSGAGTGTITPANGAQHRRSGDIDSGYCIDWCPNRTASAMMVVGLGKEEYGARIFRHDGHSRWYPGEILPGHTGEVHDVSWAPSMARSYQLIATACKDHYVRIYKLTELSSNSPTVGTTSQSRLSHSPASPTKQQLATNTALPKFGQRPMHVELVAAFDDHQSEVWRVKWNITGTILSSTGDDGNMRLWKAGYDGVWRQMAVIKASSPPLRQ